MTMMAEMKATLVEVRQEVRGLDAIKVTLGSIAMDELDCPRLVFIAPYTPPERRSIKTRVSDRLTKAVLAQSVARVQYALWPGLSSLAPLSCTQGSLCQIDTCR